MTLLVLFCVALRGSKPWQRSAKNSDPADIADEEVAKITPSGRDAHAGDLDWQLRETLRRVRSGEALAALSKEACERARVQVAQDSERAMAWVGRVSGVIRDELGNPVDAGEVSVHVCRDWTGGPVVLAGMLSPWIDDLVARAKGAESEGGVVMTSTEARALAALLIEAAERAERAAATQSRDGHEVQP